MEGELEANEDDDANGESLLRNEPVTAMPATPSNSSSKRRDLLRDDEVEYDKDPEDVLLPATSDDSIEPMELRVTLRSCASEMLRWRMSATDELKRLADGVLSCPEEIADEEKLPKAGAP
jgi:hypothetical protein